MTLEKAICHQFTKSKECFVVAVTMFQIIWDLKVSKSLGLGHHIKIPLIFCELICCTN